ncbi:hypothetical protein HCX49_12620 [Sphingobacterium kitahiroshimense]|uniref:hypothetical protein n=1 Tax=Sphingobacterium sp. B16(2022) TaxID=2914044 RepID=UPI00143B5191|nr:hypothetical protein [Sphingobacterium sp. B16(2022)]NJI74047.1 hypothetical protein [Sphingobacterium sp. B16(2022)]
MKHQFTLPDFPDSNFEIEVSFWTGKQTLYKDEVFVERSSEKGKPFLIPDNNGDIVKAFPKSSFPDIIPVLQINNLKYNIVEKLKWYQAVLAVMPFSIVFIGGGALGGGIGAVAFMLNLQLLRNDDNGNLKYLKAIGVIIAAFAIYFLLSAVIWGWIN